MIDSRKFENRKYDVYVWVKVGLPLNHLARPIFGAVRNGNVKELEKLIPSPEIIHVEVIDFA